MWKNELPIAAAAAADATGRNIKNLLPATAGWFFFFFFWYVSD